MAKEIYTREEFERLRIDSAKEMAGNEKLQGKALDVLVEADKNHWIHQANWFGEPALNLPQDLFALQEIIYKTRPKYIIEVGVAWGGSLLFYSTLMEALGGEKIIGIDIYIPEDLKGRLSSHGKLSERIELINGSSVEEDTFSKVKAIVGDCRECLIILDSHHSHDHVLQELNLYSQLIGEGCYLICGDTIVEDMPVEMHRKRAWGPGDSPKSALREFLKGNNEFESDMELENKLLFTCNPSGYLRRIKK
jgi:cephalosporin hydroxylase